MDRGVETAHRVGLKTTSTIMYGQVDVPEHWAQQLMHLRRIQQRTGGITEFVPLPFIPNGNVDVPSWPLQARSHLSRVVLMHAAARLAPSSFVRPQPLKELSLRSDARVRQR